MKICLQAGHKGMTTGATGAPNERTWTTKFVPLLAKKLEVLGYEVYQTDAFAQNDSKVTGTDWNLFLSIHYDADIYNDRGGFVDTPDQSVDYVSGESSRIAKDIKSVYFTKTGIPEKPARSNANTKFYYMWSYLSANTPCVLIECGVGNRKPEDNNTLFNKIDLVADSLSEGIHKALGGTLPQDCSECEKELQAMRESRDKWKKEYEDERDKNTKEVAGMTKHIEELQKTISEHGQQTSGYVVTISNLEESNKILAEELVNCQKKLEVSDTALITAVKENERLTTKLKECKEVSEMKNPIFEAVKEPLRLLVLAIVPFAVAYFTSLPYEWAGVAVVVLRFVDKVLHEVGKAKENETLVKGLVRF